MKNETSITHELGNNANLLLATGWVSVKDKLPKQATFVIAYKSNGLVLGLYYNADREFKYGEQDQTNQVTHWMPVPPPPACC